ncbi:MAG: dimethylaniline monooxygenase (N-oxide forming), partial [Planctomycetota bacterium]
MRIAIIGAGISGIAAAHILTKCGHEVVVFEKSNELGGIWALAYPGVKLQNTRREYHLSDMPWRIKPDLHPSGAQIRDYLNQTAVSLQLDIRKGHEVLALIECDTGWRLKYHDTEGDHEEEFSFVLVAVGQYTEGKHKPRFPGQEKFKGQVLTERDVKDLDVFDNKNTVIVGFGKSAVDMTTFAAKGARQVYHVFRTPRWMIPFYMLGIHYAKIMFCRMGTMIIPAWAYPSRVERVLHEKLSFIVKGCWKLIEGIISLQCKLHARGLGKEALTRLKTILPTHPMVRDLRSAAAMSPEDYFPYIAEGKILPIQSELEGFTENGLKLKDGSILECDQVVLCLGSEAPSFPFLEDKYRQILEAEIDGIQLYRHLLHPRIPNLAFAGFNHGFM